MAQAAKLCNGAGNIYLKITPNLPAGGGGGGGGGADDGDGDGDDGNNEGGGGGGGGLPSLEKVQVSDDTGASKKPVAYTNSETVKVALTTKNVLATTCRMKVWIDGQPKNDGNYLSFSQTFTENVSGEGQHRIDVQLFQAIADEVVEGSGEDTGGQGEEQVQVLYATDKKGDDIIVDKTISGTAVFIDGGTGSTDWLGDDPKLALTILSPDEDLDLSAMRIISASSDITSWSGGKLGAWVAYNPSYFGFEPTGGTGIKRITGELRDAAGNTVIISTSCRIDDSGAPSLPRNLDSNHADNDQWTNYILPHTFTWNEPATYGPAGLKGYVYTTDGSKPTKDSAFTPMKSFTYDPANESTAVIGIQVQVAAISNTGKVSNPAIFRLKIDTERPTVIE